MFKHSQRPDFQLIRDLWKLQIVAFTTWDIWGPCSICGRRRNDGQRRRVGHCRLKNTNPSARLNLDDLKNNITDLSKDYELLYSFEVSCNSIAFNQAFPYIANITRNIPGFIWIESCSGGVCYPGRYQNRNKWDS